MHAHEHTYPKRWLALGVSALALAGFFAITLVIGRTPQLKELQVFQDLFAVALVVHVDLSVWVWFSAIIAVIMSLEISRRGYRLLYAEKTAFWCVAAGTVLLTLSPLDGQWVVVKSNYIPVLLNVLFFLGLSLLATGLLILSAEMVYAALRTRAPSFEAHAATALAVIILCALGLFVYSGYDLPQGYEADVRFEYLFWAGGHTMQHAFSLAMMVAWAALFHRLYAADAFGLRLGNALVALSIFALLSPLPDAWRYAVDDASFQQAFTNAMIRLGGIAPMLALGTIFWRMCRLPKPATWRDAYVSSLIMSMLLFLAGGMLGLMIQGQNVIIPAHYHGSIVAVTIALMGYGYTLMPRFGFADVRVQRLSFWQPILYGVGQLMHIGGLAYSGGYGVLRKTAAAGGNFAPDVKVALGFMGLGGLLAIIGGLIFVMVMWRSYRHVRA